MGGIVRIGDIYEDGRICGVIASLYYYNGGLIAEVYTSTDVDDVFDVYVVEMNKSAVANWRQPTIN